MHYENP
jgi:hypothetical protein